MNRGAQRQVRADFKAENGRVPARTQWKDGRYIPSEWRWAKKAARRQRARGQRDIDGLVAAAVEERAQRIGKRKARRRRRVGRREVSR